MHRKVPLPSPPGLSRLAERPSPEAGPIRRILIVEDEPLIAFDNEYSLSMAGYEVVATVDNDDDAIGWLNREGAIDLLVTDIGLARGGSGLTVARLAHSKHVPVLFVTGNCPATAEGCGVACLKKPYVQRDLIKAVEVVGARLDGRRTKRMPRNLLLYGE